MSNVKDDSFLRQRGWIETSPGVFEKSSIKNINNKPIFLNDFKFLNDTENDSEGQLLISFPVDPIGKPRMTQQDKWKKRPTTDRYWELKSRMKKIATGACFELPESNIHMIFYLPMADSWSKKKKEEMDGKPHKQKPDGDNILKGVQDALCKDDSFIWDVRISKYWAYKGRIDIYKI